MTPQNESTWNFIYAHEGQNTCSVIATVKSFDIISSIVRAYNAEEVYIKIRPANTQQPLAH